jgi:hypothetical protein
VGAALLSNHRKLFNEINSLRERLLARHWPAKRAWLLRGRPRILIRRSGAATEDAPTFPLAAFHSLLSAIIGSIAVTRRAGKKHDTAATAIKTNPTAKNVTGSVGSIENSNADMS